MVFNVNAATARYIDSLGAAALQKAHDYTVGKEWMLLWGLLVGALVTLVIVRSGVLDRVQRKLQRRGFALRAFVVSIVYLLVSAILTLPWNLYGDWWRETSYGRTSQPLTDFLGQGMISLAIGAIVGAVFLMLLYMLIRKAGRSWWLWGGGLTAVALALLMLLSPVLIEPLFNRYEPVPAGPVRDAVVEMAGKAGIPPDRIYMYNGSRQSNNFTANAGGVGSTARVAISDVAFKTASLDEVRAVTGHEIGHYVLKHTWWGIVIFTALAMLFFWLAEKLYPRFARAFGTNAALGEPRGLPVLAFVASVLAILASPVVNLFARTLETQADLYSLRTENRPDALSSALVKTAEYRYPRPGAIEEFLFYDHPSVERRVRAAMQWKAQHAPPPQ